MNFSDYNKLTINGLDLRGTDIVEYCKRSDQENIRQIGLFMSGWMNGNPVVELMTSGSTGTPKIITIKKDQMLHSAAMTAAFFHFEEGRTALLCLPMSYIAGKMMVVRALYSRLNLYCIEPDKTPLDQIPLNLEIDFAPLTPMQLAGAGSTGLVRRILLGGSSVNPVMEDAFQKFNAEIFHGYGMTETLSHIAIRKISGNDRSGVYHALPGVFFDLDERDCLIIDVPFLDRPVYTNDVVKLINDQEFIWLGRSDNVVNSGGVKLFPEEIEKKLFPFIPERFFVAGLPDERFGEKLCLFIEGEEYAENDFQRLINIVFPHLDRYEKPRDIFFVKNFKTTESGKIKRQETVEIVL